MRRNGQLHGIKRRIGTGDAESQLDRDGHAVSHSRGNDRELCDLQSHRKRRIGKLHLSVEIQDIGKRVMESGCRHDFGNHIDVYLYVKSCKSELE